MVCTPAIFCVREGRRGPALQRPPAADRSHFAFLAAQRGGVHDDPVDRRDADAPLARALHRARRPSVAHPGAGGPGIQPARGRDGGAALSSRGQLHLCAAAVPFGPQARRRPRRRLPLRALPAAAMGHLGRRRRVLPPRAIRLRAGARRGAGARRHLRHVLCGADRRQLHPSRRCAPRRASPSSSRFAPRFRAAAPNFNAQDYKTALFRVRDRAGRTRQIAGFAARPRPEFYKTPRGGAVNPRYLPFVPHFSFFGGPPGSNSFIDLALHKQEVYMSASPPRAVVYTKTLELFDLDTGARRRGPPLARQPATLRSAVRAGAANAEPQEAARSEAKRREDGRPRAVRLEIGTTQVTEGSAYKPWQRDPAGSNCPTSRTSCNGKVGVQLFQ